MVQLAEIPSLPKSPNRSKVAPWGLPFQGRDGVEYQDQRLDTIWKENGWVVPLNPPKTAHRCKLTIAEGVEVQALSYGGHILVGARFQDNFWHEFGNTTINVVDVDEPFIQAKPVSHARLRTITYNQRVHNSYSWNSPDTRQVTEVDSNHHYHHAYWRSQEDPHREYACYIDVEVTFEGETSVVPCRFRRPDRGRAVLDEVAGTVRFTYHLFGLDIQEEVYDLTLVQDHNSYLYQYTGFKALQKLHKGNFELTIKGKTYHEHPLTRVWGVYINHQLKNRVVDERGIKAVKKKKDIAPNLERLKSEELDLYNLLLWLQEGNTWNKASNNKLLSAFLLECGTDYDKLKAGLLSSLLEIEGVSDLGRYDTQDSNKRRICMSLPGAQAKQEEELAKKQWQYRKGAKAKAEGLGIDPKKHPKLLAAVENGDLSLACFHEAGKEDHLVNVEFDLWERALKRPGWAEALLDIGKNAGRRTTYEKDVTPYMAFLFHIEKYLKRHTGRTWKAMPRHVASEYELEMTEAGEETVKTRSAMTPIADNENNIITVPYVSLSTHGVVTTYCYSLRYCVFEENQLDVLSGKPIQHELQEKLNGRDDYGLMYYTLTGSAPATGYPTFLIIFERLGKSKKDTRVHFHRVHPNRSKGGVPTPPCRIVEECYRYMAGNIRAEEICAQQGDLIFIRQDKETVEGEEKQVSEFESHRFIPLEGGTPVTLIEKPVKSIKNRLGFIRSETGFSVVHPEHEDIEALPAGLYEVRRCRSWEANPKAIWSLTID